MTAELTNDLDKVMVIVLLTKENLFATLIIALVVIVIICGFIAVIKYLRRG